MNSLVSKIFRTHQECSDCPSPKVIKQFFEELLGLLFPEYALQKAKSQEEVAARLILLREQLGAILSRNKHLHLGEGIDIAQEFFDRLERVFDWVHQDVDAMYAGDPAASGFNSAKASSSVRPRR